MHGLEPANFSWEPPVSARRFGGGGGEEVGMEEFLGIGNNIEKVIIKGEDYDQIVSQANLVKYYLSQQQSVNSVNINIPAAEPEILMDFDKQLMSMYDIPASSVLAELNSFPQQFSSGVKFKQGNDEYDIQIRMEKPAEQKERNLSGFEGHCL